MTKGLRELKTDNRDFKLGAFFSLPDLSELPEEFILGTGFIDDQEKNGHDDFCSAYATCGASELQEEVKLSPGYSFALSKELSGDLDEWGQDLRTAIKAHTKFGAVEEKELTENERNLRENAKDISLYRTILKDKAIRHSKKSYFLVKGQYDNYDNIRASIWKFKGQKKGVVIGLKWSWSLNQYLLTGTNEGFGHAVYCFHPETQILTKTGYKNISEIKKSEYVLTHNGNWKKVIDTISRKYNGELKSIKFHNTIAPIFTTPEHPFYIKKITKWYKFSPHKRRGMKDVSIRNFRKDFDWLKAEEIKKHYLGREPILKNKKKETISKEFAWLLGLYVADGNLKYNIIKGKKYYSAVRFSLNFSSDKEIISKTIEYMNKEFKLLPKFYKSKIGGDIQVIFYNTNIAKKFLEYGGGANNKNLDFNLLLNAKTEILDNILQGWLAGDGCYVHKNIKTPKHTGFTSSKKLALQIKMIIQNIGYNYTINRKGASKSIIRGKKFKNNGGWIFSVMKKKSNTRTHYVKNAEIKKVENIDNIKYDGYVYNLEVEDDNSYIANGISVHNCTGWNKDGLEIVNSYGLKAGMNGTHIVSRETVNKFVDLFGAFMMTDQDPEYIKWALENQIKEKDNFVIKFIKVILSIFKSLIEKIK